MNNTIIIPSSIFTNSYFYQHEILEGGGATNWPNLTFYGDNESSDNTTAHISGIISGNLTGDEVLELLTELSKNTTGIVTYNYSLEDPTRLNLPPDALKLVPFSGYGYLIDTYVKLSNSPTGQLPQSRSIGGNTPDSWLGDLAKGAVNLGISVGTAVWDKAVDLGTELAHIVCSAITAVAVKFTEFVVQLGKAIIDFGKKVIGAFEKAMAEVKAAVEKVVDVIASFIDWVTEVIKQAFSDILKPLLDAIESIKQDMIDAGKYILENLDRLSPGEIQSRLTRALHPEIIIPLFIGITVTSVLLTIAAKVGTMGTDFIFGILLGIIVGAASYMVEQAVFSMSSAEDWLIDKIQDAEPSEEISEYVALISLLFSSLHKLIDSLFFDNRLKTTGGFVLSLISVILVLSGLIYEDTVSQAIISIFSMVIGVESAYQSLKGIAGPKIGTIPGLLGFAGFCIGTLSSSAAFFTFIASFGPNTKSIKRGS